MELTHRLVPTRVPRHPEAVALLLHGGASRGEGVLVSPTQLSVLRMIPTARRTAGVGGRRLAVYRLLNSYRGWDTRATPVGDVHWALDELRERHGDLPVALVGHSLGGRAALMAGDRDEVRSVVALNPWVYPDDDNDLSGRRVLVVHGDQDRIADPRRSAAMARRLARRTDVGYIEVAGGKHAMLRHGRRFDSYAAQFVAGTLLEKPVRGPVAQVLDGSDWVSA